MSPAMITVIVLMIVFAGGVFFIWARHFIECWKYNRAFWAAWKVREAELDLEIARAFAWAVRYAMMEERDQKK